MIDLEKSKIEAEALAKLRKEQYFREVLAGELGVLIDQYFASKEPLKGILPEFCTALKDVVICAREIFDYLEGKKEEAPEDPEQAAEEEPTKAAGYVTNEEIESLLNQGLTHKQIADKTGMKPNTVSHRIAYINDKKGTERPEYKPKTYTKELISDTELEEMYFKQGLTVKEIAEKYNVNPAGLYKRTEALKDKRFEVAKECVSSQRSKD